VIQAYFDQIKAIVDQYAAALFVLDANVSFEMRPGEQGYLVGSITFLDGSALHFREYLDAVGMKLNKLMHTYHYQMQAISFYAANALLSAKQLSRGKHSGVIAAFRQYFVKPGSIEAQYSRIYGQLMDDRHGADYDLETDIEPEQGAVDVEYAHQFVRRARQYLQ